MRLFKRPARGDTPWKIREAYPVVGFTIFVQKRDVIHRSLNLIFACLSILLNVPIGMSRLGTGTVTLPFFVGCLNCLWLPTWLTSYQPSSCNRLMTSRLCTN